MGFEVKVAVAAGVEVLEEAALEVVGLLDAEHPLKITTISIDRAIRPNNFFIISGNMYCTTPGFQNSTGGRYCFLLNGQPNSCLVDHSKVGI